MIFCFLSSTRRHTRWPRDWSSDVCSSDLYSASKAGVLGFTRVLAVEWARRGVTINAVSPTIADTALAREIWVGEKGETAREEIPAGRFVTPEEIASLVAYLASEDAAMVTGENLRIDGGRSVI